MKITYPDPGLTNYASFLIESTLARNHITQDITVAALLKRLAIQTKDLSNEEFEVEIQNLRRLRAIENGSYSI